MTSVKGKLKKLQSSMGEIYRYEPNRKKSYSARSRSYPLNNSDRNIAHPYRPCIEQDHDYDATAAKSAKHLVQGNADPFRLNAVHK